MTAFLCNGFRAKALEGMTFSGICDSAAGQGLPAALAMVEHSPHARSHLR